MRGKGIRMTHHRVLSIAGAGLLATSTCFSGGGDLSGTWKFDPTRSEAGSANSELMLLIERKGDNIHVKETRGPNEKEDVTDFTCSTVGGECGMRDGSAKAKVDVYYNGDALVILKTHGRKGSSVEKRRLTVAPGGDVLTVEVIPVEPAGKTEKLVFTKAR